MVKEVGEEKEKMVVREREEVLEVGKEFLDVMYEEDGEEKKVEE